MVQSNEQVAERLIDALIEREGGYVDHPGDKGGPTRFGITQAIARAHGYAGAMAKLPRDDAAAIYRRLYWLRPRFDDSPGARRALPRNCLIPARTWGRPSRRPFSSAR